MPKFTQKSFDDFCEALNHRMTRIENDVRWMRRITGYLASVMTGIFIKVVFFQ